MKRKLAHLRGIHSRIPDNLTIKPGQVVEVVLRAQCVGVLHDGSNREAVLRVADQEIRPAQDED